MSNLRGRSSSTCPRLTSTGRSSADGQRRRLQMTHGRHTLTLCPCLHPFYLHGVYQSFSLTGILKLCQCPSSNEPTPSDFLVFSHDSNVSHLIHASRRESGVSAPCLPSSTLPRPLGVEGGAGRPAGPRETVGDVRLGRPSGPCRRTLRIRRLEVGVGRLVSCLDRWDPALCVGLD